MHRVNNTGNKKTTRAWPIRGTGNENRDEFRRKKGREAKHGAADHRVSQSNHSAQPCCFQIQQTTLSYKNGNCNYEIMRGYLKIEIVHKD